MGFKKTFQIKIRPVLRDESGALKGMSGKETQEL